MPHGWPTSAPYASAGGWVVVVGGSVVEVDDVVDVVELVGLVELVGVAEVSVVPALTVVDGSAAGLDGPTATGVVAGSPEAGVEDSSPALVQAANEQITMSTEAVRTGERYPSSTSSWVHAVPRLASALP